MSQEALDVAAERLQHLTFQTYQGEAPAANPLVALALAQQVC